MAVSKSTRKPVSDTTQRIQQIFRSSRMPEERKREWDRAVRHAEAGTSSLHFPIYEHLYHLNVSAQRLVDLLKDVSVSFGIGREDSLYHQSLIQQVRASVSSDIVDYMSGVEHTDEWAFESLRRSEENNLRDPDEVYFQARNREKERAKQGLPPRIRFLDEERVVSEQITKTNQEQ